MLMIAWIGSGGKGGGGFLGGKRLEVLGGKIEAY